MKTVWRFELKGLPVQVVEVPKGTALYNRGGGVSLYGIVDSEAKKEKVTIVIARSGEELPLAAGLEFLGQVNMGGKSLAIVQLTKPDAASLAAYEERCLAQIAASKQAKPLKSKKPSAEEEGDDDPDEDEDEG